MKNKNKQIKQPLVSVLMPVFNGGEYIDKAIASIVRQSYDNWELLVVDDASGDNTWELVSAWKKRYPNKIIATRLRKNRGQFGAVNAILKKASGKYLAPMDSDDVSHPNRLELQVAYLETHLGVGVVGSKVNVIDGKGNVLGEKRVPISANTIREAYGIVHPMVHPAVMIRRSILSKPNKLYYDRFGMNDDYFTLMTLVADNKFVNLRRALLDYRVHGGNGSHQDYRGLVFNTIAIRIKAIKDFGYQMSTKSWVLMGMQYLAALVMPDLVLASLFRMVRWGQRWQLSVAWPNFRWQSVTTNLLALVNVRR